MAKKKSYNQRDDTSGRFESKADAVADPKSTQKERRRPLSDSSKLYNKLTRAIDGLAVRSESSTESPLRVFKGVEIESKDGLTSAEMLDQISRSPDTPIEERDFERFISNLVGEGDETHREKVLKLQNLIKSKLTEIHVYAVPSKSRKTTKKLYIVGIDSDGLVTGLRCGNVIET